MFTIHYIPQNYVKLLFIFATSVIFLLLVAKSSWRKKTPLQLMEDSYETFPPIRAFDFHKLKFGRHFVKQCDEYHPPFLLAIVHSSPTHFLYRSTIRKTWGSIQQIFGRTLRVVFLVGLTTNSRIQTKLKYEMKMNVDIVQGDFVDSYKNLTLKHLLGYKWVLTSCPNAKFVLKADDDVFIDIFRAVKLLLSTFGLKSTNLMACLIVPSGTSPRTSGKWAITKEEFQDDSYPEYCSGMSYFVTTDVISKLYEQSKYQPFFWIDDIFVTGLVAGMINAKRTDLSVWFARNESPFIRWMADNSTKPCPWLVTELSPGNWPENATKLWLKTVKAWNKKK